MKSIWWNPTAFFKIKTIQWVKNRRITPQPDKGIYKEKLTANHTQYWDALNDTLKMSDE